MNYSTRCATRFWPTATSMSFIEYAKAGREDLLCRITAINRGPDAAPIHVLPHVWYRNTWSWEDGQPRAVIEATGPGAARTTHPLSWRPLVVRPSQRQAERRTAVYRERHQFLADRQGAQPHPYVKDGINDCRGRRQARVRESPARQQAGRPCPRDRAGRRHVDRQGAVCPEITE